MSKRELTRTTVKRNRRVITTIVVEREITTAGPIAEGVGRVVRRMREEMMFTQHMLAEALGYSRASIANIECGRQRILFEDVWRFAAAFKVNPDGLMKAFYKEIGATP